MNVVTSQNKMPLSYNHARSVLREEPIRKLISKPRLVHRRAREEIALLLAEELRTENQAELKMALPQAGAFTLLLKALESSEIWKNAREIASRGETASMLVLEALLPTMLEVVEHPENLEKKVKEEEEPRFHEFMDLMADTRSFWEARSWEEVPDDPELVEKLDALIASDETRLLYQMLARTAFKKSEKKIKELCRTMELLDILTRLLPSEYAGKLADLYALYIKDIDALAQVFNRSQDLKQILQLLGRMEAETDSRRARLRHFSSNESHSLHQSHDISRVLPVELVKLRDPTLRKLFYSRFLEGNLLSYELKKPEKRPEQLGPVVVLVDASGSMCGDPELMAKALILSISRRMAKEKRGMKVILFSTRNRMREMDLSLGPGALAEYLDFFSYVFEGGTDFNSAIKAGLEEIEKEGWRKSDLLFISDGLSTVSEEVASQWSSYRSRTGSKIFTLVVGSDDPGGLESISDFVSVVKSSKDWDQEKGPANILERMR